MVLHGRKLDQSRVTELRYFGQRWNLLQEVENRRPLVVCIVYFFLNDWQQARPVCQRFHVSATRLDLALQRANPPAQFLETDFAMLVNKRVHNIFDLRSTACE